jgi:small subunit ribosomal protein S23
MGRQFRPIRVKDAMSKLIQAKGRSNPPVWFNALGSIPPSQTWVRTWPVNQEALQSKQGRRKAFRPQRIQYPEDQLRKEFYKDHPWELARPRILLEEDGRDAQLEDWSQMRQPRKALSGESVVQRQIWLLENDPHMTKTDAYDQARAEFYALRHQEQVEQRVAREEALAVGAYFGLSQNEIGMKIEDSVFENWKKWATAEAITLQQSRGDTYAGSAVDVTETSASEASEADGSTPSKIL